VSERGYFAIGIVGGKNTLNVGTLWRSAGNMGAAYIFTIGRRYPQQASDTIKAWKHIPLFDYATFDDFAAHRPKDCMLIGVEQTPRAVDLPAFTHPERAIYLLGAEDTGLPSHIVGKCQRIVQIPSARCLNVSVAGSIVMYDRNAKQARRRTMRVA
jgi:tRNA G18 (ribose-2'-O)-methylase SpoU